jgi:CHAT domain-containing protein/tetratricopeptide (TPR) repeat protein
VDLHSQVELRLAAGETKTVRVSATAGEYLEITATPDSQLVVRTSLFDPTGQLVAVTPSLGGTGGSARIVAYASASGDFRLQVTSQMFRAEVRNCSIALVSRRSAGEADQLDAEAHREFAKAASQAASGAQGMRTAIATLDKPIELARRAGDNLLELRAVFGKGQFHAMLGEFQASLPFFTESLELCRKTGDKRSEAHTLDDTALVYANLERYSEAIDRYNQALELHSQIGQPWETALTLGNLADAESAVGRIDISLECLRRQEQIRKELNDEFGLAETRMGMADVDLITGEQERALEELIDTLPHWPRFRDREDGKESEIAAYRKLGFAYTATGNYDSAAAALRKAMSLARSLGNPRVTAETLVVEAQLAPLRGDNAQALKTCEQALAASRAAGYQRGEALALIELAKLRMAAGQPRLALSPLEQALRIATQLGQPYDEANARRPLGMAHAALGETSAAEHEYLAALAIERQIGDRFGEVQTLVETARLEDRLQQPEQSLSRLEEALAVIDRTRSSLAAPELRATYLASQRAAYELSARVLMRLYQKHPSEGYELRALDVSERAHARTLLDAMGGTHVQLDRAQDRELRAQLDAVDASLHLLASGDDSARLQARIATLLTTRSQLELQVQSYRAGNAGVASEQLAPLPLAAIRQQVLHGDTILLEYFTGVEQSHLWVVSRTALRHYALPGEAVLGSAVRRLYDSLTAANHLPLSMPIAERQARLAAADDTAALEARNLQRLLLPLPASVLGKGALLIVADGPVQMAPFAFLPDPGDSSRRLGSVHTIAVGPSASVLAQIRKLQEPDADGRILIVADPVYSRSDPRFGTGTDGSAAGTTAPTSYSLRAAQDQRIQSLPRLPMSRTEAEHIAKLAPGRATTLLDFNAAPDAFERLAQDRFSIIHIAAHTVLDYRHPDLSGLVLSLVDRQGHRRDGFVPLLDIYKLRLHAGLVVLSACETYIGKDLRGEGFLGLARGFLYAGARQVLASLWKVDDRATAVFMERFYVALLRDHLSAPAALRRAQNEMAEDAVWRSPRYWAGFVLEGDIQ